MKYNLKIILNIEYNLLIEIFTVIQWIVISMEIKRLKSIDVISFLLL